MKRTSTDHLQEECFLLLLESSLKAIPFNIFLSIFITIYLIWYLTAPLIPVLMWCSSLFIISLIRWIYCKKMISSDAYIKNQNRIIQYFLVLTFLTGLLWGISYIAFYHYFSSMHHNIITLVLGGMVVGAIASLSVYLPAYYAYLYSMFIPLIIYNYWLGGMDHIILASMFIIFVIMLTITARFPSTLLQKTIKLNKEKDHALQEIQRVSITDSLTGLYNRRYFDERLNEEFRRAQRNNHSLNLVLIDIDDFKLINDNFGHPSGDLFLKQLADAIKHSAKRANDTAFRIGGDEFAAILTNTSLDDATTLCNNLQDKFKMHTNAGETTISIGIISVPPLAANNVDEVISAADKILYEAKKAGKNQLRSQQLFL